MSTEYRYVPPTGDPDVFMSGEVIGRRWGSSEGLSFDWGPDTDRTMNVHKMLDSDDIQVHGEDGWRGTGRDFLGLANEMRWTHGEYGGSQDITEAFRNLSPGQFGA